MIPRILFTHPVLARLWVALGFLALLAACTFVGSTLAIVLSDERVFAWLGVFVALPLAQALYALLFMPLRAWLGLVCAAVVSALAYVAALAAVDTWHIRLVHDFYGVLDVLALYALISLALWEGLYWLARTRAMPRKLLRIPPSIIR